MTTAATVRHWFGVPEHTTSLRDRLVAAVAAVGTTTTSWLYPLTPVLLNAPRAHRGDPAPPAPVFTAEQLQVALAEIDIIADMSDEDLQIVYQAILRQQRDEPEQR